jgi:hypothetical protein
MPYKYFNGKKKITVDSAFALEKKDLLIKSCQKVDGRYGRLWKDCQVNNKATMVQHIAKLGIKKN